MNRICLGERILLFWLWLVFLGLCNDRDMKSLTITARWYGLLPPVKQWRGFCKVR